MDQNKAKTVFYSAAGSFLSVATLALLVASVVLVLNFTSSEDKRDNTITVSGYGEVFAAPDIASFSFTTQAEDVEVEVAQEEVTDKTNDIIGELVVLGLDKKDIQTTGYRSYPRYEYRRTEGCLGDDCDRERVLVSYELSTTVNVKVRDLENVGDVVSILGGAGVHNLNGPNYRIEDPDDYKAEARTVAIAEAKEKAKVMADNLGVKLGKVVSFYEDEFGGGYPMPMMTMGYADDVAEESVRKVSPVLPEGEETVSSRVNITFKIK